MASHIGLNSILSGWNIMLNFIAKFCTSTITSVTQYSDYIDGLR